MRYNGSYLPLDLEGFYSHTRKPTPLVAKKTFQTSQAPVRTPLPEIAAFIVRQAAPLAQEEGVCNPQCLEG